MNQHNNHPLNLALQGGGSHGASTWGVLDALLEDRRIDIEGISGTSAGAMNAVALAHGFAQALGKPEIDPRDAAREPLPPLICFLVALVPTAHPLRSGRTP